MFSSCMIANLMSWTYHGLFGVKMKHCATCTMAESSTDYEGCNTKHSHQKCYKSTAIGPVYPATCTTRILEASSPNNAKPNLDLQDFDIAMGNHCTFSSFADHSPRN